MFEILVGAVEDSALLDMLTSELLEGFLLGVGNDGGLAHGSPASMELLIGVFVGFLTAEIRLVNLYGMRCIRNQAVFCIYADCSDCHE